MRVNVNKTRIIKEFIHLVKIDSESGNEEAISLYLKQKFTHLGLVLKEDNAAHLTGLGANNLICTLKANTRGVDPIFFTSHMDTVKPGNNIKPAIIDDYLVSNGKTILGADDKAGIAVMIEVIKLLQENNLKHGQIQFVITVGEEVGLLGARALDKALLDASYGYALDADGAVGEIVVKAPYQMKIFTEINGKSAHAGINPEKGISAINVASKAISQMKLGRIDSETTANIGSFKGGTQTNVVCDFVEIEAEARSLSKVKLKAKADEIKQTFEQVALQNGAEAVVKLIPMYEGYSYNQTDCLVKRAVSAAKAIELPVKLVQSNGGSDANIFNSFSIPTVNLAVGYEYIHTVKERIHVDNLFKLARFVLQIIEETTQA